MRIRRIDTDESLSSWVSVGGRRVASTRRHPKLDATDLLDSQSRWNGCEPLWRDPHRFDVARPRDERCASRACAETARAVAPLPGNRPEPRATSPLGLSRDDGGSYQGVDTRAPLAAVVHAARARLIALGGDGFGARGLSQQLVWRTRRRRLALTAVRRVQPELARAVLGCRRCERSQDPVGLRRTRRCGAIRSRAFTAAAHTLHLGAHTESRRTQPR